MSYFFSCLKDDKNATATFLKTEEEVFLSESQAIPR